MAALSELISLLPAALLAGTAAWGRLRGVDVMAAFAKGAQDALRMLLGIFPALLALLTAVAMLRASGALDALTGLLSPPSPRWASPPRRRRSYSCGP